MLGRRITTNNAAHGRGRWRRAAVGLAVVIAGLAVPLVSGQGARAAFTLTCDPASIFNLDTRGNVYGLAPATRVNTLLGNLGNGTTDVNALGVTPGAAGTGAVLAYAAAYNGGSTVYRSDGQIFRNLPGLSTSVPIVMGAVDPDSGIYYYAGFQTISNVRYLRILAFDPRTATGLGEVARVRETYANTGSGDFAFDLSGNLYILIGRSSASEIVRVDAADLPTTAQSTPPVLASTSLTTFPTPSGGNWNGIAFAADGNLYAQYTGATAQLAVINPNNPGAVTSQGQSFPNGYPAGAANDLAGCSTPGTLTVQKSLTRAGAADQFVLSITAGGTQLASQATTGTAGGLQADVAGPIPGLQGTVYTISEQLSDASATSPAAYADPAITCVNTNTDPATPVTVAAGPDPRTFTLVFPTPDGAEGANVVCTFTNAPAPPRLTVRKALAGTGRIAEDDQFSVHLEQGGAPVGSGTPTTTGTGATVTPGTGTLTVSPATAGAAYTVSETMAPGATSDLSQYQQIIACTDRNGVQRIPRGPAGPSTTIRPAPGSDIDCVITNAPELPLLSLTKTFVTHRVRDTDQFTVAVHQGSPGGPLVGAAPGNDPTTAGTGSTVLQGSGTTGYAEVDPGTTYYLTEAAEGSADLALYTTTVTCSDANGLTTGLPVGVPLSDNPSVTPVARSLISCTVDNAAKQPTLQLSKALSDGRVNPGDQYTVRILDDDQSDVLASATTAGAGRTITPGTGETPVLQAAAGSTYLLDEVAAGETNLGQYTQLITCSDANGVESDLPTDIPLLTAYAISPQLGADISCTITNTPSPPSLRLQKALGSTRANPEDQFTVQIRQGGAVVGQEALATTEGTGADVTPGFGLTLLAPATPGTGYTLTEVAARTADLEDYSTTTECVDNAGVQSGLPTAALTRTVTITPVDGASILCTITNTVRQGTPGTPSPPTVSTPHVHTATSDHRVTPHTPFHDRIHVDGLAGGRSATAVAQLYGPFASRAKATCGDAPARSARVTVHNGWNRTPAVRLGRPGIYTWKVTILPSATNHGATHGCGQPVETTTVAKRSYPAPIVNGGFSGTVASSRLARLGAAVRMPAIGLHARVRPEVIAQAHMTLPQDVAEVGWLRNSAEPRDKIGVTVIGGHVSDRHDRPGALVHLSRAHAGQRITVTQSGTRYRFKVVSTKSFDRRHRLPHRYFATTGRHRVVLISCTDRVLYPNGHFHYTRYVVVVARQWGRR